MACYLHSLYCSTCLPYLITFKTRSMIGLLLATCRFLLNIQIVIVMCFCHRFYCPVSSLSYGFATVINLLLSIRQWILFESIIIVVVVVTAKQIMKIDASQQMTYLGRRQWRCVGSIYVEGREATSVSQDQCCVMYSRSYLKTSWVMWPTCCVSRDYGIFPFWSTLVAMITNTLSIQPIIECRILEANYDCIPHSSAG